MRTSLFKSKIFPWFLILSGVGALWLTVWFFIMSASVADGEYSRNIILTIYYAVNSLLLLMSGISLRLKYFREYSLLSILLGISVTVSLFIFTSPEDGINFFSTWFVATVMLGVLMGFQVGGIVLVPMFLISVYTSLFLGIQYFRGKIDETSADLVLNPQINSEDLVNLKENPSSSQNTNTSI